MWFVFCKWHCYIWHLLLMAFTALQLWAVTLYCWKSSFLLDLELTKGTKSPSSMPTARITLFCSFFRSSWQSGWPRTWLKRRILWWVEFWRTEVCTPEFKGLLLSSSVLVRNGGGGVSIKEARKKLRPPKEMFHIANTESRDKRGFIQLPNSGWLHWASGLQAKILKGAEENQVERDIFWTTVVPSFTGCFSMPLGDKIAKIEPGVKNSYFWVPGDKILGGGPRGSGRKI